MQKEKIRNSILGILAFVLLFYEIIVLKGENYYLVSMAVLLIALFGFFAHFEKERPGVMLLTMIASLCALAIAGRIAFFFLPQIKPIAIPQMTDCSALFPAATPCMASLVVITGFTMNLMPRRNVINTEKFPMVVEGTRLEI